MSEGPDAIMKAPQIQLPMVDEAQITLIVDNSIDLLMPSSQIAQRFMFSQKWLEKFQAKANMLGGPLPYAEHGFSALISVRQGSKQGTVLFDTGISPKGTLWNLDALEIDLKSIQAIVLSHGHPDHVLGLPGVFERLGSRNMPLVLHPDAYLDRKLVLPDGVELNLPAPKKQDLRRETIEVIESVGSSMLLDEMVLISGEVARTTDFETGFPIHFAHRHGKWEPDALILDDQCVIINLAGKGLVVLTGCGHSGVINTIRHAQQITGVDQIYAVIGGFHLSGAVFEPIIPATIEALKEINPRYIMPGHCTGWRATHQIAQALPEAFIPNSVGTTLIFTA
jgi:7,8-dihydropterin-6-yl-methyl-4-(beta-D-ribofuranosyl)aminobenzene 5'-phosphate synthase